jgi:hypothetical protein
MMTPQDQGPAETPRTEKGTLIEIDLQLTVKKEKNRW